MQRITDYLKKNRTAFWISFAYVTLGGLSTLTMYPGDPFHGSWSDWALLITLPVSIISFAYRFTESPDYFPVLIIQLVMWIPSFFIVSKLISIVKNRTQKQIKDVNKS